LLTKIKSKNSGKTKVVVAFQYFQLKINIRSLHLKVIKWLKVCHHQINYFTLALSDPATGRPINSQANLGDSLREAASAALCRTAEPKIVRKDINARFFNCCNKINYALMSAALRHVTVCCNEILKGKNIYLFTNNLGLPIRAFHFDQQRQQHSRQLGRIEWLGLSISTHRCKLGIECRAHFLRYKLHITKQRRKQ
jgi:hypothetical protein